MTDPKYDEELLTFSHLEKIEERLYYTLTQDKELTGHRTAKAIAGLFQQLHTNGVLTKEEVDAILRECVY
ncbi:MAG TPA: hypothetical protein DER40_10210 [Geobacter sp.]|nr:MAG: hypothetical protein A2X85_02215 [Geobacteraceae bacterium GWF2_54_21]HBA71177.1 hypothetical protein [Geobacter sp.]HCE67867.1 hypothetical protein [Geobacter sp.]